MMHIEPPPLPFQAPFLLEGPPSSAAQGVHFFETGVAMELGNDSLLLDGGRVAQTALSCLVRPQQGDRVLAAIGGRGDCHVLHVLSRAAGGEAVLSVPGARELSIRQQRISLAASERLALQSLADVDVTAAAGTLRLTARNLFSTVAESLVENARHRVGQIEHYLLRVKRLLRVHGEQVMVTAEKDVKVDGERISMG